MYKRQVQAQGIEVTTIPKLPYFRLQHGLSLIHILNGKETPAVVTFTGEARSEFKKFQPNLKDILSALPYVPEVIESGDYPGRREEPNHGKQVAFHTKMKTFNINGKERTIFVDIGETKYGTLQDVYKRQHFHRGWRQKTQNYMLQSL